MASNDSPPAQRLEALRQDRKDRYPQQRARPEADQGAEPVVRTAERRAQSPAADCQGEGQHHVNDGQVFHLRSG